MSPYVAGYIAAALAIFLAGLALGGWWGYFYGRWTEVRLHRIALEEEYEALAAKIENPTLRARLRAVATVYPIRRHQIE